MLRVSQDFNPTLQFFRQALKADHLDEAIHFAKRLHSLVHDLPSDQETFQKQCLAGMSEKIARLGKSTKYDGQRTLLFFIYHMTRIEDICANELIAQEQQVIFQPMWQETFQDIPKDTGNSWNASTIDQVSHRLDINDLFRYRQAVGEKTQKTLSGLTLSDLKKKPTKTQLQSLLENGSIVDHPSSVWLLDFWGKKNKAQLIQMPLTRHQLVHLSDCEAIIRREKRKKQSVE